MPLDPRLLLTPVTPNLMDAISQGLSAGQVIRQAPLLEALQKQQLRSQQAQFDQQQELAPLQQQVARARLEKELQPQPVFKTVAPGEKIVELTTGETIATGGPKDAEPKLRSFRSRVDKFQSDFVKTDAAFRKVSAAPETAAGDLSLIFGFMKLLDPGSTVREGEFANAQNATGVPGRIANLYNNILKGERLSTQQRGEFKETAGGALDAQRASADAQIAQLLQQADQDNIAREKVLGAKSLRDFEKRAADRLIQGEAAPQGKADPTTKKRFKFNSQTGQLE